ncbi:hypothetical protein [Dyella sp. GSA-30]|uniref:hypothetical protein n=1 Tax=Dyella sp. GSA-30 TaxID=2994496 RepID=UPI0024920F70|nr:hypothetical protein [Dyella sp. GSA-30]BDU22178.1 hypothetical protein DYGSA30_36350 [Dyella sp. GSA-30]
MIHRKLNAGVVLFLGMIMAGSAAAAGSSAPKPQTPGTSTQNAYLTASPAMGVNFAQLTPRMAFTKVVDGCEHVTHENFCACYPDTCH